MTGDSYATWGSPVQAFNAGFENVFAAKIASSDCPIINSVRSKRSTPGSTATIYGLTFSPDKSKNTVRFGKNKAEVKKATTTRLTVKIPSKSKKGVVGVDASVNGARSNTVNFQVK